MWRNILGQGAYQLVVLFGILYLSEYIIDDSDEVVRNTFLFNSFVFCQVLSPPISVVYLVDSRNLALQVFNEVNSRRVGKYEYNVFSGLHTNWVFIAIIAITVIVQALIVEFGDDVFRTAPLSLEEWGYSVAIGAGSLVVGFILRFIPIPDVWCCSIRSTPHARPLLQHRQ